MGRGIVDFDGALLARGQARIGKEGGHAAKVGSGSGLSVENSPMKWEMRRRIL